jgi:hypothetical protein
MLNRQGRAWEQLASGESPHFAYHQIFGERCQSTDQFLFLTQGLEVLLRVLSLDPRHFLIFERIRFLTQRSLN